MGSASNQKGNAMSNINGLYSVLFFNGVADFGAGTVSIRNGSLNGGDHGFSYQGRVEVAEGADTVTGQIQVKRWNQGVAPVIPGLTAYVLDIKGSYDAEHHTFKLEGAAEGMPGSKLRIEAKRLADLVE